MKPLNTCCLCCKLETGAYILGALGTIVSIAGVITLTLVLENIIKWKIPDQTATIQIVLAVTALICFILLIWGTKKRKCAFLIPYLVFHMMNLILKLIAFITYLAETSHENDHTSVPYIFAFAIGWTLGVYIEMCIYSLFLSIETEMLAVGTYKHFEA